MKGRDLLKHPTKQGCEQLQEGPNHSWWYNPKQDKRSAIPRYTEISENLARKICKDLGIPDFRF